MPYREQASVYRTKLPNAARNDFKSGRRLERSATNRLAGARTVRISAIGLVPLSYFLLSGAKSLVPFQKILKMEISKNI